MKLGTGRRLAISDIHGCGDTFISLLDTINLDIEDNLFILGDMINRGKRSKKVIKTILQLQKSGYHIYPLRGNHEQYLLAEINKGGNSEVYNFCKRIHATWVFYKDSLELKQKYLDFFNSLPYYYDLEDRLLSHAGFDLTNVDIFENTYAMLHQRNFNNLEALRSNTIVIHGHTPIDLKEIKNSIKKKSPIINIDNGCVYQSFFYETGNLVCLDMDSFMCYYIKNID